MSKARNISNIFSGTTDAATDAEVTAAIASHNTSANGHVKRGGTASRPGSPSIGDIYYNTDLKDLEQYTEDGWLMIAKQPPRIPTIGTATLQGDNSVSVSFTPSSYGQTASSYTVQSNPGSYTATGSSSPITFPNTNLTMGTAYTFRAKATGTYGDSGYSGYTGSVTPTQTTSFESIATVSVGSGGTPTVIFSSIPSTYTHLQIRGIVRNGRAVNSMGGSLHIKVNSDATSGNYKVHRLYGNGSTIVADSPSSSTNGMPILDTPSSLTTASAFGGFVIDILDYANTSKYKTVRSIGGADLNGSGHNSFYSGLWMNTSAITSLDITNGTESTVQYSHFALYGIKGG